MSKANISSRDWHALEKSDDFAGTKFHLEVSGKVGTHASNERAILAVASSPGINPTILLLSLTIEKNGPGSDVEGETMAETKIPVKQGQYKDVQIVHGSETVAVVRIDQIPS